jgi:type IV fimbrial biogenesis protein FimT
MRVHLNHAGVSLIELLVVLTISAVLMGMAAPSFNAVLASVRLKTTTALFISHLNLARSEAIKRNSRAVLCKSSDGLQCTSAGGWEQGWIVFHDANDNALVDHDEAILLQQPPLRGVVKFAGNTNVAKYVSYTPDGGANLVSGNFQAGTFIVCAQSIVPTQARQILLSKAGQARWAQASASACD